MLGEQVVGGVGPRPSASFEGKATDATAGKSRRSKGGVPSPSRPPARTMATRAMSRSWRVSTFLSSACTCPHGLSRALPSASTPFPPRRNLSTSPRLLSTGPISAYDAQVASGAIKDDPHQRSIVLVLQELHNHLAAYNPPPIPERSVTRSAPPSKPWFSLARILGDELSRPTPTSTTHLPAIPAGVPKGLYLYGSVGCGKSYLMDLFYANLPKREGFGSRRVHFHAFMVDVHKRGHRMKQELGGGGEQDWIVHAARDLASEARVLCFDEFQVRARRGATQGEELMRVLFSR